MSEVYDRYGRPVVVGFVVVLAGLSVASAYLRVSSAGLAAAGDALISLYIAGVVVWGTFREGYDTARFRIALYGVLVLWGSADLIAGSEGAIPYLFLIGGSLLIAWESYSHTRDRGKPVYER
ncbi:hypothetical protein SAMN04488066_101220 [Halorubrum aquaticum]|uniref:Uncharacterized protein n=1 Tax=Halorubrum aquaticum TaxID=387340 RepID=A0A1I2Z5I6_9EURY|nr:hypothetical protein [Halorubrum aquaticum]SFH32756.1 hypothetical protein SAMN04488066_101220 [Halorubrum aquaticum]